MAGSNNSVKGGGKNKGKDVKLQPGDLLTKEVYLDVGDIPLHVFGTMPEDHSVTFFRVYNGDNECLTDIPEAPVVCKDGTSPLALFNVQDPEVAGGRSIQNDIWLLFQGRYRIQYNSPTAITEIPDDVYVWVMEDTLVPRMGINLPLCGVNVCEPDNFCLGGADRDIVEGDVLQICENGVPTKVRYVNPDTFTTVTDNGDNTYTATMPDGSTVTWIGDTFGTVTDNGDGTITICNPDGSCVTFDRNTFTQVTNNGDGTFTSVQPNGIVTTWVGTDQFMVITDNGDGSFTGINVDGTPVTWIGTDQFMNIVDNGDGTYTGTNVDGTLITWDGSPSITTEGLAIDITGSGTQADPFVVNLDLCELPALTAQQVTNATTVMMAACVDGQSVLIPRQPAIPVTEGLGIDVTGGTNENDPYVVSLDNCELPLLDDTAIQAATDITVSACVDGQTVRLPYEVTRPGPTGTIEFPNNPTDCSNIEITMFGNSDPDCPEQGILQADWWLVGGNGVTIGTINTVANPTFPLIVTVDLCSAVYPVTANLLLTDACGQGGDISGNGLPARDILLQDLPIANIQIPATMNDSGSVTLNASLSTPSDGNPGGVACPNITAYEYTIRDESNAVYAVINTGATGTPVNSGTHPLITGGTAESPIVNLDGVAGQTITVELLVTDCNGTAGADDNSDGIGDAGNPDTSIGYVVLCESVQVRDTTLDVPAEVFTENDFSTYTEVTPNQVFTTSASGNGSLGGSINLTFNAGPNTANNVSGNTRLQLVGTSAGGPITHTFNRQVCAVEFEAFDVDVPNENLTNFNPGTVTINPPFGNQVLSIVRVDNINATSFTFEFTPGFSFAFTYDIVRVETCAIISPCFAATKCTAESGAITYTRDSNGQVLNNADIVEC